MKKFKDEPYSESEPLENHHSCNNCKAFWMLDKNGYCDLGYALLKGVPQQLCPKPLTNKKYYQIAARKSRK